MPYGDAERLVGFRQMRMFEDWFDEVGTPECVSCKAARLPVLVDRVNAQKAKDTRLEQLKRDVVAWELQQLLARADDDPAVVQFTKDGWRGWRLDDEVGEQTFGASEYDQSTRTVVMAVFLRTDGWVIRVEAKAMARRKLPKLQRSHSAGEPENFSGYGELLTRWGIRSPLRDQLSP